MPGNCSEGQISLCISPVNFFLDQRFELLVAKDFQRPAVDKNPRRPVHLQGHHVSDILLQHLLDFQAGSVCPGFCHIQSGVLDHVPE